MAPNEVKPRRFLIGCWSFATMGWFHANDECERHLIGATNTLATAEIEGQLGVMNGPTVGPRGLPLYP